MDLVSMKLETDCGPTEIANLRALICGTEASVEYDTIITAFGFPGTGGLADDMWDNPTNHLRIINKITKAPLECRVVKREFISQPCGILVRNRSNFSMWHWVVYLGSNKDLHYFHNGHYTEVSTQPLWRNSDWKEVLRYTIADNSIGSGLPWYWNAWYNLTKFIWRKK